MNLTALVLEVEVANGSSWMKNGHFDLMLRNIGVEVQPVFQVGHNPHTHSHSLWNVGQPN